MSFEPLDYVRHILAEVDYLIEHSRGVPFEQFEADETLRRAFVRSLEVIGEATKKLPSDFCASHPQIQWSPTARMRDRLIHGYFGVDYQIVWDVVMHKIPALQLELTRILAVQ